MVVLMMTAMKAIVADMYILNLTSVMFRTGKRRLKTNETVMNPMTLGLVKMLSYFEDGLVTLT